MYTIESAVIRGAFAEVVNGGQANWPYSAHSGRATDRAPRRTIAANESSEWFSAWFRSSLVLMIIKTRARYLFNKKQANISAAAGSEQFAENPLQDAFSKRQRLEGSSRWLDPPPCYSFYCVTVCKSALQTL